MTPYKPIDAEARGQYRVQKADLERRAARIERALKDDRLRQLVPEFLYKRGLGRKRAVRGLCKLFAGANLEQVTDNKWILWRYLRPRCAVTAASVIDDPGQFQNCITVNYLIVGDIPNSTTVGWADGLRALECSDHALQRLLQRDRKAKVADVILAAHRNLLNVQPGAVATISARGFRFLLPAGNGVFVCHMSTGTDRAAHNNIILHARTRTWLHNDELRDDQIPIAAAIDGEDRLGNGFFLPAPLVKIEHRGNRLCAYAMGIARPTAPV